MVKITPSESNSFLQNPKKARAVLIYGPDQGLVSQRSKEITKKISGANSDEFSRTIFESNHILNNPSDLLDSINQPSLLSNQNRVTIIRGSEDSLKNIIALFLEKTKQPDDAYLILEGSELGPKSKLRTLFEKEQLLASLACYHEEKSTLSRTINQYCEEFDLKITSEAKDYLIRNLGKDREISRMEIEKLSLFANKETVDIEVVVKCIGDNSLLNQDIFIDFIGLKNIENSFKTLERLTMEGVNSIAIIRLLIRHFHNLHSILSSHEPNETISAMWPPIHFKRKKAFNKQLQIWSPKKLDLVLETLNSAEIMSKLSGIKSETILKQALLKILLIK